MKDVIVSAIIGAIVGALVVFVVLSSYPLQSTSSGISDSFESQTQEAPSVEEHVLESPSPEEQTTTVPKTGTVTVRECHTEDYEYSISGKSLNPQFLKWSPTEKEVDYTFRFRIKNEESEFGTFQWTLAYSNEGNNYLSHFVSGAKELPPRHYADYSSGNAMEIKVDVEGYKEVNGTRTGNKLSNDFDIIVTAPKKEVCEDVRKEIELT